MKYGDLKSPVKESNLPIFFFEWKVRLREGAPSAAFCDMFDPILFIFSEFLVQRFLVE